MKVASDSNAIHLNLEESAIPDRIDVDFIEQKQCYWPNTRPMLW